ncbi:MAG: ABC transporter family substrate-binding protein [Nocardiaceae bacterium]|nr:ABC transporter family substrate-binding protein [Nocardiaceae bacterium]
MRVFHSRRLVAAAMVTASALSLASCTANPPPPIQAEPSTSTTVPSPENKNRIVVAVDDIGTGMNPHLLSDQSPANAAVGSLVLPSPFRPVPGDAPGSTAWVLDKNMMVSAEVTSTEPFTITYKIRDEAQWSDGAPIAAEDFQYLWQQMTTQPGAVDPAGYQLIDKVVSAGGGKTVNVVMKSAYPAWRELFTSLLPSHLVKDSPGGFEEGLASTIPVSGGLFHIKSVDRGRGEILLERNDRFWDKPATPDQILIRRSGNAPQLAESMRSDDAQMALVHVSNAVQAQLQAIEGVNAKQIYQPRRLQLVLNGRVPKLADVRVRAGVLGLLDPGLLATVAMDTGAFVEPARAQILSPSDPGYAPTAPPPMSGGDALGLLAAGGFPKSKPLALRIGVPENDTVAFAVASTAADQLRAAGLQVTVDSIAGRELYGTILLNGEVDIIVGWERAGTDAATTLASRFACPAPSTATTSIKPTTPTTTKASEESTTAVATNLSGICDKAMQDEIAGAIDGDPAINTVLAALEPKLWALSAVLPIVQDQTMAVIGPGVTGATLNGALPVGIFADAEKWAKKTP